MWFEKAYSLYFFVCPCGTNCKRLDQILLAGENIWPKMTVKSMKSMWVEKFENCCSTVQKFEGWFCICRALHDTLTFLWEISCETKNLYLLLLSYLEFKAHSLRKVFYKCTFLILLVIWKLFLQISICDLKK